MTNIPTPNTQPRPDSAHNTSGDIPKDWLWFAIIAAIACWPLGIPAIMQSIRARNAIRRDDLTLARKASRTAVIMSALGLSVTLVLLCIGAGVWAAQASAPQHTVSVSLAAESNGDYLIEWSVGGREFTSEGDLQGDKIVEFNVPADLAAEITISVEVSTDSNTRASCAIDAPSAFANGTFTQEAEYFAVCTANNIYD
ncbi:CD225/dispanin family protein [Microbacterium sp. Leaf320]|uniref:CD225/dispanin family protein n=1 Tax=Microbacterium sp. Leaf320 TaxID=1736334 RepID=UPI000A5DD9C9|nr:CD225/dispanin family protein [Microbacterium sp. Leaf320]